MTKPAFAEDSICIIDFAGNNLQPGMWCDFFPADKEVRFGGYWLPVPGMPCDVAPTEAQCEAWAAKFAKRCKFLYWDFCSKAV